MNSNFFLFTMMKNGIDINRTNKKREKELEKKIQIKSNVCVYYITHVYLNRKKNEISPLLHTHTHQSTRHYSQFMNPTKKWIDSWMLNFVLIIYRINLYIIQEYDWNWKLSFCKKWKTKQSKKSVTYSSYFIFVIIIIIIIEYMWQRMLWMYIKFNILNDEYIQ